MRLGKLHVVTQRNWSAKGHTAHYEVCGSSIRPHRIKIDEEEGIIIITHELGMLLVSCSTPTPIQLISTLLISPDYQPAWNNPLDLCELDFPTLFLRD